MSEEITKEVVDGLRLGLDAISEVLTKQNDVLNKMLKKQEEDDEEEEKKAQDIAKADEKAALVKEVTDSVIKALGEAGAIKKEEAAGSGPDSDEKKETIDTKPGDQDHPKQQEVIQASKMQKQDDDDDDKEEKSMKKQDDEEDKKEEKEDEDEKDKEYPEVEKLKKQIEDMQKSFDSKVANEVESRLRKAGWKEEKGLASPKRVELGADEPVLKKGMDEADRIDELKKLDYRTLKELEMKSDAGELPEDIASLLT